MQLNSLKCCTIYIHTQILQLDYDENFYSKLLRNLAGWTTFTQKYNLYKLLGQVKWKTIVNFQNKQDLLCLKSCLFQKVFYVFTCYLKIYNCFLFNLPQHFLKQARFKTQYFMFSLVFQKFTIVFTKKDLMSIQEQNLNLTMSKIWVQYFNLQCQNIDFLAQQIKIKNLQLFSLRFIVNWRAKFENYYQQNSRCIIIIRGVKFKMQNVDSLSTVRISTVRILDCSKNSTVLIDNCANQFEQFSMQGMI
eukprot:TRINITY_DN4392_c1_g2_i1.p2 TRINITY_DN4392_c1_g2~~TRINITY_DN4392_c1_g2_i1.p2  ORF type:complete len:248 (-),score=-8.51 TRINITY_DN4392_c1_g2_i1:26-769(-)